MERYDIAIIGTGPAGISAALTAKARNKRFILLGSRELSQKIRQAHRVDNYPGLSMISGEACADTLRAQLDAMKIPITEKQIRRSGQISHLRLVQSPVIKRVGSLNSLPLYA